MPLSDDEKLVSDATALHRTGRVQEAIELCETAARRDGRPIGYVVLARILSTVGRVDDAIAVLREATASAPSIYMLSNLGMLLLAQNRPEEAILPLRDALAIQHDFPDALSHLGVALRKLGRPQEALGALRHAVASQKNFAPAWINLAGAMLDLEMFADAEAAARTATTLAPNNPVAHFNLATALKELARTREAVTHFEKAISFQAGYVDALTSLGNTLHHLGKYDAAINAFRTALQTSPDDTNARWNLSLTLLLRGEYSEAWPLYEARWRHVKQIVRRDFPQPRWDGADLHGQRILLHFEQGLGDTLQFIRYAPMVAARGGRVMLLCQPELERLMRGQCGIELVTSDEKSLPAFDVQCPLLSLPLIFKTTIETIPAPQSYLKAGPTLLRTWQRRIGPRTGLRVGLNWAGSATPNSNRRRTIGLAAIAPLASMADTTFFSLQVGTAAAEAATRPAGMTLLDCSPHLADFSETAALMSTLDVVVTCDTSVAHAAGALGVPTCVLLPTDADWRWMLERSDSPWYPSMSLFRQPTPGDYATPMREVVAHLSKLASRV